VFLDEYPYPLPDGTKCMTCVDVHGTDGHFVDEVCDTCGNDPFGGPQNDDWIHNAYEAQADAVEARRRTRSEWITLQLQ